MARITITPESLREIADDLEREGRNFVRTVVDDDGNEIDFVLPEIVIHLPDSYDENKVAGTACGLVFGVEPWSAQGDAVITDPEESGDVTCPDCLDLT